MCEDRVRKSYKIVFLIFGKNSIVDCGSVSSGFLKYREQMSVTRVSDAVWQRLRSVTIISWCFVSIIQRRNFTSISDTELHWNGSTYRRLLKWKGAAPEGCRCQKQSMTVANNVIRLFFEANIRLKWIPVTNVLWQPPALRHCLCSEMRLPVINWSSTASV